MHGGLRGRQVSHNNDNFVSEKIKLKTNNIYYISSLSTIPVASASRFRPTVGQIGPGLMYLSCLFVFFCRPPSHHCDWLWVYLGIGALL